MNKYQLTLAFVQCTLFLLALSEDFKALTPPTPEMNKDNVYEPYPVC